MLSFFSRLQTSELRLFHLKRGVLGRRADRKNKGSFSVFLAGRSPACTVMDISGAENTTPTHKQSNQNNSSAPSRTTTGTQTKDHSYTHITVIYKRPHQNHNKPN